MRHVFKAMGTSVSVQGPAPLMGEVEAAFEKLERRFSLFRPTSEASRIAGGDLLLTRASQEMREMYSLAHDWRLATGGAFRPHRPDGVIDLGGVVKAKAIEAAGEILASRSLPWLINAGGDVLGDGSPWVVGIVDPADRSKLLTEFTTSAELPAVATSGVAERGEHIWRAGTPDVFSQVTVAGPDIVTADVLATAIMAAGVELLDEIVDNYGVQVIAITRSGNIWATPAFRKKSTAA